VTDDLTTNLRRSGSATCDRAADEIDRLRAELEARSVVSSDVNAAHADEVRRLRATIAERDEIIAGCGATIIKLRATIAAVVEGER